VPHVEQELLILSEHPSFWAIKKLCSFSWTFPENSRRLGGFYFYMMFMILVTNKKSLKVITNVVNWRFTS
jgi:hypothetical protein